MSYHTPALVTKSRAPLSTQPVRLNRIATFGIKGVEQRH